MMALKIKLVRSLNSCKKNQIATAHSLGLRKVNSETTQPDNEATKGKIKIISHLVKVEEV
ncbi:MAG: 50S ribosomal protein L30 [Ruminococcaceae bacterium]|nr:50S ribosomal protein L30 [Oscillospiraceae bacterium]